MTFAYVGCRTTKERGARGKGLSVYTVEQDRWTLLDQVTDLINPSYLILDSTQQFLYTVHGDHSEVSGFRINPDGTLSFINRLTLNGLNPVHLSLSKNEDYLVVACLQTGNVVSIKRDPMSGELTTVVDEIVVAGIAPTDISHPHQVYFDHENSRILVPCQGRKAGISKVVVIQFDDATGRLSLLAERVTRKQAEARHLCIHPNGKFVYLVNEIDNTICFYQYDGLSGNLIPIQILSTLAETCTSDGWASGIALSGVTNTVIVSNRTNNSLSWYRIDPKTGFLSYIDTVSCLGDQPRFICLDATERLLYIANENTDNLVQYTINEVGDLVSPKEIVTTGSPVSIAFKTDAVLN